MSINDNRVFGLSNTGTTAHAFLGSRGAKPGNLRAACRVTIQRAATSTAFISLDRARKFYTVCDNCVKLFLAAEDGTVKLDCDELTRRGHWADVSLADGRAYSVSMKVHRKGHDGGSRVLVDHVIYWSERGNGKMGQVRVASENDKPGSVGGRIWRLLLAANIA